MKKRLGWILCCSGTILLVQPNLSVDEVTMLLNYIFVNYWPLLLVVLGASLIGKSTKPRRNKN